MWFFLTSLSVYLNFGNIWNAVIIITSMFFSTNSNIHINLGWFWLNLLQTMGPIFLPLCMAGDLWLEARYCEFYLIGFWIFLYFSNSSWFFTLRYSEDTYKKIDIWGSCFYYLLGGAGAGIILKLIIPTPEERPLPRAPWVMSFSRLAGENRHNSQAISSNPC